VREYLLPPLVSLKVNMTGKKKAIVQVTALTITCGLIFWHAVYWHSTGMYRQMLDWLPTGKAYLTVLYNLGLMLVTGTVLAFLVDAIATLITLKKRG